MIAYAIRRILYAVPITFGVAIIVFILFHVAGGDPMLEMAGRYATADEIEALRHQYGFDRAWPVQFLHFLKEIVTFDFGRSFSTKQTISRMFADGALVSFSLMFPAFVLSSIISLAIALIAAALRATIFDRLIVIATVLGMSISILVFILLGQYFLAFSWGWFPITGYEASYPSAIQYLVLPWIIWIVVALGADVRFFRTVFLEEMNRDYVRTAKAKGLGTVRVLFVHVFRNAMIPIITRLVIEIPFLVLGSLLLENFFGIPGLGSMMINAINSSDWPVIKAITIGVSIVFILGNLISDLLYAVVDPRVTLK